VKDWLANSMVPPPYSYDELVKSTPQAPILREVRDRVLKLLDKAEDVREYLKEEKVEREK